MDDIYADWARVYDYFYPDRSDEVDYWARLAKPYGRRVLDLMCGTAEVSLALARRGCHVLGIDYSSAMLSLGAERLAAAADFPARNLSLARGDAVSLAAPDAVFDFVLVGGTGSFNHLDDQQTERSLRELARVLRPGGALGMELVNPYLLKEIFPTRTFGPLRSTPPDVSIERTVAKRYDRPAGRYHIHQVTRCETGPERAEFEESFTLHVRQPAEVQALLTAAGFDDMQLYGDYTLGEYSIWSFAMLVVAEKAA